MAHDDMAIISGGVRWVTDAAPVLHITEFAVRKSRCSPETGGFMGVIGAYSSWEELRARCLAKGED